jgi:type I restriction-modification system DNA methylase subunit
MLNGDTLEIKKDLGQFFTPKFISDFMVNLIEKKKMSKF